jgi:NTP pyrophosphatase (non-canonical NTP hydrolase)
MDFSKIISRAKEVRALYAELEKKKYGQEWTPAQIAQGFVGDVGDLMKLIMSKEGIRDIENNDEKLKHELCDCLWSLLTLADKYNVNLEETFISSMDSLEKRIKNEA